jgi:hypothetical protein
VKKMNKKQYRIERIKQVIEETPSSKWRYPVRIYDGKGNLKEEISSGEEFQQSLCKRFGINMN